MMTVRLSGAPSSPEEAAEAAQAPCPRCDAALAALRLDVDALLSLAIVAASTTVRANGSLFEAALWAEYERLSTGVGRHGPNGLRVIDRLSELVDEFV